MQQGVLAKGDAGRLKFLEWPFFDEAHRRLGRKAAAWARGALG